MLQFFTGLKWFHSKSLADRAFALFVEIRANKIPNFKRQFIQINRVSALLYLVPQVHE